jgi:CRP/FNR family cyclic AMP-dependent transcriptional regulator
MACQGAPAERPNPTVTIRATASLGLQRNRCQEQIDRRLAILVTLLHLCHCIQKPLCARTMLIPDRPKPENKALEQFLHYCHKKRYSPKCDIIQPGDKNETLYYIIDGSVSIIMEGEDGQKMVLAYINRGQFIGEAGVFVGGGVHSVTMTTRVPCHLAEISYARFHQVLKAHLAEHATDILYALGQQLSNRLLQTSRKVGHLAFLDVTGRIARTLIDLAKEPDAMTHPDGMQIKITRQEIGRIVGCSREMAGRVLKNLQNKGMIHAKGKTIVVFGTR